jgi:hypothetical protein
VGQCRSEARSVLCQVGGGLRWSKAKEAVLTDVNSSLAPAKASALDRTTLAPRSAVAALEAAWLRILRELHPRFAWGYEADRKDEAA